MVRATPFMTPAYGSDRPKSVVNTSGGVDMGMGRSERPELADPNTYDRYHNEGYRKEDGELEKSFLEAASCANG